MAPPRFQCLNAARQINKNGSGFRAAFSTSQVVRADGPSATSSLLDSMIIPSSTPKSPSSSSSTGPAYTNPITIRSQRNLQPGNDEANKRVFNLIAKSQQQRLRQKENQSKRLGADDYENSKTGSDLSKQITRRWKAGDVYAPHDLSEVEMAKWKRRGQPSVDVFDILDFNPVEHYRNFSIMSEYMTDMGASSTPAKRVCDP